MVEKTSYRYRRLHTRIFPFRTYSENPAGWETDSTASWMQVSSYDESSSPAASSKEVQDNIDQKGKSSYARFMAFLLHDQDGSKLKMAVASKTLNDALPARSVPIHVN